MGFLLAIEGADGAGKATASALVVEQLLAAGRSACVISFPRYTETVGGWALGAMLAGTLPRPVSPKAAATLYALDRMESRGVLMAALDAHEVVVFDRYIASNMAYQAAQVPADEAGAMMEWIAALETGAFALPAPNLSIYLDTPADIARGLILKKRKRSYTDDTFDAYEADTGLQDRVRANYAAMTQGRVLGEWLRVSTVKNGASRPPADIAAEIVAAL
ncbi:thymidylate kinase [Sphingomonas ginsenosidivorax]|uniref:Thymidylate kinase n=1 Tax=Sphingomonas ginsenosidivorax TaxID=862135 RepID=A0A5C6UB66_9SPHN|nr:thymidylate kinase [Sphingomonas ginsenosidivorax]TXC69541.1 thymidylate kinase [Sphingomonas ginsenosidivorax]TXC72656.1 thymidylate kinase [Sphingomonas ginsenosidivorax]